MSSAICFNLDQSKILSSGNGLKVHDGQQFSHLQIFIYSLIFNQIAMFTQRNITREILSVISLQK